MITDEITDTRQAIAALGGISHVARELGHRHPSTVQGWVARNRVPPLRAPELLRLARHKRIPLRLEAILLPGIPAANDQAATCPDSTKAAR